MDRSGSAEAASRAGWARAAGVMHALDGVSAAYVPSASKGVRSARIASTLEGTASRLMGNLGRVATRGIAGATKHVRWACAASSLEMAGAGDRSPRRLMIEGDPSGSSRGGAADAPTGRGRLISARPACECSEIANRRKARPPTARRRMPADSLQRAATKCPFPPRRRPTERLGKPSTPEARPSVR
jgi:hypothetical protein